MRRIILNWALKYVIETCGLDLFGSEQGPVADCCCECGDELSCSIEGEGFID